MELKKYVFATIRSMSQQNPATVVAMASGPICGSFNDHYEGDDCCFESGYSCGDYEIVTEEELLKLINEFKETDDEYVEFK